jgi:pimeloyl-ACP methyl ester carboxylesterase
VLVCVHGLTRCGRDFDFLAEAMAGEYRVVCPDIVGRGRSDWLRNKSLYAIPQYCADIATLLAKLGAESVDWVGTSMGGLIGMALAIQPETPIRKLVLNDVGPVITAASLERIGMYLGRVGSFDSIEKAESAVRFVSQPFGQLTDAQWRHLTVHVTRQTAEGKIEFAYDPGIAEPFKEVYAACGGKDVESWPLYDAIACPTLLLRGREFRPADRRIGAGNDPARAACQAGRGSRRRPRTDAAGRRASGPGAGVFARLNGVSISRCVAASKYFMGEYLST